MKSNAGARLFIDAVNDASAKLCFSATKGSFRLKKFSANYLASPK